MPDAIPNAHSASSEPFAEPSEPSPRPPYVGYFL